MCELQCVLEVGRYRLCRSIFVKSSESIGDINYCSALGLLVYVIIACKVVSDVNVIAQLQFWPVVEIGLTR